MQASYHAPRGQTTRSLPSTYTGSALNPLQTGRHNNFHLKVVGNEKQWGSGRRQMLGSGLGPWRSRFIYNLNMQFWIKIIFPFPLSPAKWVSDYFDIEGCGANNEAMTRRSSLRQWRCGPNSQHESWTCGFFFLFWPHLLLLSEHLVRKLIDAL